MVDTMKDWGYTFLEKSGFGCRTKLLGMVLWIRFASQDRPGMVHSTTAEAISADTSFDLPEIIYILSLLASHGWILPGIDTYTEYEFSFSVPSEVAK